ncbi:PilX N-terminal domain-containing pilus assembly protein [Glaciimonas sp. Gout2]|uniref:pilus assembly PilX family protein n=2 Tax=unclassified Glaciimonas TaxID=2644401 RepID=UPI002B23A339|nr:PilX N-terminal domain-containing pilus assembly protein [Glaciimonas sp. Cout2]MEB0012141.1 PilX N-terminal domain-containing pilus assembly protein [Glaciimonas sp. Cout2]MEB0083896.1 PilX N-terminal domain-containing pilus assembly protein [Glaciimonas sp. Gout2]
MKVNSALMMKANVPVIWRIKKLIIQSRGIALPVTLIFLLVMTIIGVAAIRNVTLEEKMAGNLRSQQLAFEAAEQVLRYCEKLAQELSISHAVFPPQLPQGPIADGISQGKNHWELSENWRSDVISIGLPSHIVSSVGLVKPPRCMIEKMALTGDYEFGLNPADPLTAYRITARGVGVTTNVTVLLQSYLRL